MKNDQKHSKIQIDQRFEASPAKVWQAWTDPAFMTWFGGDPNGKVLSACLDVRVGGRFEITFDSSDKRVFTCSGKYTAVNPCAQLAFTWLWKGQPDPESAVTVELAADGIGTRMRFDHSNLDANSIHDYERGWKGAFTKLERMLKAQSTMQSGDFRAVASTVGDLQH